MQLLQLRRPLQWVATGCKPSVAPTYLINRLVQLRHDGHEVGGRRYASVKAQGAYKKRQTRTRPKKLGAKKTGDQYVIPGNIIYKQRGTVWHPGANVHMGRDHTIHASVAGYVKYYRDPLRHPRRQYIGVTFTRDEKLPYSPGAPRRRKLGLLACPRKPVQPEGKHMMPSGIPLYVKSTQGVPWNLNRDAMARAIAKARSPEAALKVEHILTRQRRKWVRVMRLRDDYSYRETNWEIGRLMRPRGNMGKTVVWSSSRKAFLRKRNHAQRVEFARLVAVAKEQRENKAQRLADLNRMRAAKARERKEFMRKQKLEIMKSNSEDGKRLAAQAGEKSEGEKSEGEKSEGEKSEGEGERSKD